MSKRVISNEFLDSIFVDRYSEIDIINNEYEQLLEGSMGIVAIAGMPGIGKNVLGRKCTNAVLRTLTMHMVNTTIMRKEPW